MKKKIINGILIVAALFATSTSFVSCKDNLDPVVEAIDQVEKDMNTLQEKISAVEGKISQLEGSVLKNSEDIAKLQTQLATLQSELSALQNQVNQNTADIAANKAAIEALTKRVDALEEDVNSLMALINNLAVGITVRQTIDPVIGSINLPGYNPLFLAAYAGENLSGIAQFPFAGDEYNDADEYNVDPYGWFLGDGEIAVDPVWINDGDKGWNGLIMGYKHNAGTLYFTLNPIGLDASNLSFDLVNSLGTVSPVIIDNVQQSSYINSPSIGKHGNGSEEGEVENPYLYSAEATIPLEANADLAWNKEINSNWVLGTNDGDLNHELSLLIAQVKAGSSVANIFTGSFDILQNFYQRLYKDLTAKQYQNLRVTYNDGNTERIITSPENIVTATVSPLSYKYFWDLGGVIGTVGIDWGMIENVVGKFVNLVQSKMPNINIKKIEFSIPEYKDYEDKYILAVNGQYAYVWYGDDAPETGWYKYQASGSYDENDKLTEGDIKAAGLISVNELVNDILAQIEGGFSGKVDRINDMIAKVLKQYTAIKTDKSIAHKLVDRASSYLGAYANKFITALGANPAYNAVTPIVLWDNNEGIERLVPWTQFKNTDGEVSLILTSATNEYLVPAYKKYVVVSQDGKALSAQLLDGSEKVLNVKLPMGRCDIVYSVIDFNGYVVTKRYPVTRIPE